MLRGRMKNGGTAYTAWSTTCTATTEKAFGTPSRPSTRTTPRCLLFLRMFAGRGRCLLADFGARLCTTEKCERRGVKSKGLNAGTLVDANCQYDAGVGLV